MNSTCKATGLILLATLVAGCRHKAQATPPPAAQAPIAPVSTLAKNAPTPQLPPLETPTINPPGAENPAPPPKPKPHKIIHHKPKPTDQTGAGQTPAQTAAQTPPKDQTADVASGGASADITPIGTLAPGGESTNAPRRLQIEKDIDTTGKGLDDIKRTLTKDEETTAGQIRTFLIKAKDALNQQDLDGAATLVTKARVLLNELTKS